MTTNSNALITAIRADLAAAARIDRRSIDADIRLLKDDPLC